MGAALALIRELDFKLGKISTERRASMVRHLTDLFLVSAEQFSTDDIAIIDDIFVRLVETLEESARALLAIRLGPVAAAPPKVLRLLACDNAIDVASTVLMQSEGLDDATLIKCAMTKSQEHLLAISQRKTLSELLTDVLVERGDQQVVLRTAMNAGARFSENGFGILLEHAHGDDALAGCVGARRDLPRALFEKLLEAASDAVRAKLKSEQRYAARDIDQAVTDAATQLRGKPATQTPQQAAAQLLVSSLNHAGQLNGAKLVEFARARRLAELVAALALMANMPADIVEKIIADPHNEELFVLTKAVGFSWETALIIVTSSKPDRWFPAGDIEKYRVAYQRMKQVTARKILDFNCARGIAVN
jgi:uncharacterized protein (DUF2336 family)